MDSNTRKNYFLAVLALSLFVKATSEVNVHIVYLGENKYDDPALTKKFHHKMLSTLLGSKKAAYKSIIYSYKYGFSGFAARLTKSQAEAIAEFPGVIQVIPNRIHKLHTTRSWDFMGIHEHYWSKNLLTKSMGKGTIIGVIDSGVWPESESFNDEGMDPIPSHWKGTCQQGEHFNSTNCNRKLIGARWFRKGVTNPIQRLKKTGIVEYLSPRDGIGHGTHTASTAAGYFVKGASYKGLASGLARGGAPLAHLAIYKACWASEGCSDADLLKAFDKAIHDGIDVVSLSVGNEIPMFSYVDQRDSIAIGSFHAVAKGITVVSSAGNNGPIAQTVVNTAPWLITVAATTIDRAFPTAITLGNNHTLWGQSVEKYGRNLNSFIGITYSERIALDSTDDSAKDCQPGSLNASLVSGNIVLCFSTSDQQDIQSASTTVQEAGGIGIIFAQLPLDGLRSCGIPCIRVGFEVGTQILSYIRRARHPIAKLSDANTVIGKWVSPRVASFSARGPSSMTPEVLKPDIVAPGVDIIAAFRPLDKKHSSGYALLSGTSMACPHVAGIAALIKSEHPNWSPSAIKSALVTTASQTGTDGTRISAEGFTRKEADPFDIGGGHVNPNKAINPGLIFNASTQDYIQFLCSLGYSSGSITRLTKTAINCARKSHGMNLNLNLPSITIPNLRGTETVTRRVTNVGEINSKYTALVEAPHGVKMRVEPQTLSFNKTNQILSFKVTFFSTQKLHGDYKFGSLTWTDGEHVVRSPVAIRAIGFDSYVHV